MIEARKQEAALALIADGEREIRRIHHRDPLKIERDAMRHAALGRGVQDDRIGPNQPVLLARRAGCVGGLCQADLSAGLHGDLAGITAAGTIKKLELSGIEGGGTALIVAAIQARDPELWVEEIHGAAYRDPARRLVIGHDVGTH